MMGIIWRWIVGRGGGGVGGIVVCNRGGRGIIISGDDF